MFRKTETASNACQLLDADEPQRRSSTLTSKKLARVSSVEAPDGQSSAFQVALDDHPAIQPPGWISKPRTLEISRKEAALDLAVNVVMVLVPLPFFVLAGIVASVHHKKVEHSELEIENFLQATKTASVTLYTLALSMLMILGLHSIRTCFRGNRRTSSEKI